MTIRYVRFIKFYEICMENTMMRRGMSILKSLNRIVFDRLSSTLITQQYQLQPNEILGASTEVFAMKSETPNDFWPSKPILWPTRF